jgi:hypothetical protein
LGTLSASGEDKVETRDIGDFGLWAKGERLEVARRYFTEANRGDFAREGKDWVDKATGLIYRRVGFDPLQAPDPRTSGVAPFMVEDDTLVFLRPRGAGNDKVETLNLGTMSGRNLGAAAPVTSGGPEIF